MVPPRMPLHRQDKFVMGCGPGIFDHFLSATRQKRGPRIPLAQGLGSYPGTFWNTSAGIACICNPGFSWQLVQRLESPIGHRAPPQHNEMWGGGEMWSFSPVVNIMGQRCRGGTVLSWYSVLRVWWYNGLVVMRSRWSGSLMV